MKENDDIKSNDKHFRELLREMNISIDTLVKYIENSKDVTVHDIVIANIKDRLRNAKNNMLKNKDFF